MTLAKTLLASAAVCALCTAPALARVAPAIHLAGIDTALTLKVGSPAHFKTSQVHPDANEFTETVTFTGPLPAKRVATMLWGETWYNQNTCLEPANETSKFPRKTAVAKITKGTSTGTISTCPGTTFTFYGPVYKLRERTKSDSFASVIGAKHFSGYNLTLNVNTELSK
jgi:hypothetical protein